MEEDDSPLRQPPLSGETCPRCLDFVPPRAARCPHCGQPLSHLRRTVTTIALIVGALLFAVVVIVAVRAAYGPIAKEAPVEEQAAPDAAFSEPPATSAEHEAARSEAPAEKPATAEPEKKPPLNR